MTVIGNPTAHIDRILGATESGELTLVSQTDDGLVLESRLDEAYYEQMWRERGFNEEQLAEIRKGFFLRDDMEVGSSFGIPFYGDLNAIELIIRVHINTAGLESRQDVVIRTATGEYVVVGRTDVQQAVVDAIPPEVIALSR
jgi:hypothetical protein